MIIGWALDIFMLYRWFIIELFHWLISNFKIMYYFIECFMILLDIRKKEDTTMEGDIRYYNHDIDKFI